MKSITCSLILAASIYSLAMAQSNQQTGSETPAQPTSIEVYFNPHGGAAKAIIEEIDAAKSAILVQAYSFDYLPIARALAAAKRRNVQVSVILDKDKTAEEKPAAVDLLVRSGISVRLDGEHHTAHNKILVIDGRVVITGSFNFTRHSEQDNAENLLVIRDKTLARKYAANWKDHAQHSKLFEAEGTSNSPK